ATIPHARPAIRSGKARPRFLRRRCAFRACAPTPVCTPRSRPGGYRLALLRRSLTRRKCRARVVRVLRDNRSYEVSQRHPHFLRGTEQAILGGFFGRAQDLPDPAQPQALVVPKFENHSFARRELVEDVLDPPPDLAAK